MPIEDRFETFKAPVVAPVLIHEQGGRRTGRHLRQYADSGPTLVSIEIWADAASAENAFRSGLVTWENDPYTPWSWTWRGAAGCAYRRGRSRYRLGLSGFGSWLSVSLSSL